MTENIMDHISHVLDKDPTEVRLNNMTAESKETLMKMIDQLKMSSDYDARVRSIRLYNNVSEEYKRKMNKI